ncbi:MAG: DUF3046 domain-containing protein [Bowdeniella nasicola]|nr:DUF3046 domain-containing protein [Bowdeniella nasicola]
MRRSELAEALTACFGAAYGSSLAADLALPGLGGRTVNQALEDGEDVDAVWAAFCTEMDAGEDVRWYHRSTRRKHT